MARFQWKDKEIMQLAKQTVSISIEESCKLVTNTAKSIMKSGSYAEYNSKKKDGTKHWSSKPWDAPAPDTGLLKGSISYKTSDGKSGGLSSPASSSDGVGSPISSGTWVIIGVIGTSVHYGGYVESGTSKMIPRPYLRPSLANKSQEILNIFLKNGRILFK